MIKKNLYLVFCIFLLITVSCANTAKKSKTQSLTLIFDFKIKGQFALINPNITYYVIIYSPALAGTTTAFDTSEGPRINGPILTKGPEFLDGRLPFTGALQNDAKSLWTDFFYLTGTPDGQGKVGKGKNLSKGKNENDNPLIDVYGTYPREMWSVTGNIFQLKIDLSQLSSQDGIPEAQRKIPDKITMNLVVGDNIDYPGTGSVYDRWKGNLPFVISTEKGNSQKDDDITQTPVMLQIPIRPLPTLPQGINPADVDISGYETFIPSTK